MAKSLVCSHFFLTLIGFCSKYNSYIVMEADMSESALKLMNYKGWRMIYGDANKKY